MLRIGDKVTHIEYPASVGMVMAKMPNKGYVLVRWINHLGQFTSSSRHIPDALRHVQAAKS